MREPDVSRPGSVLRAEREALGVSVREVAETLNLSVTVIEALESDDLDRLPGIVFARGYVRAYARLLELEPGPLVEQYPRAADPLPAADAPSESPIWEWIRRRPGLVLGAAGGLVVLVLVLVVTLLWPDGGAPPTDGSLAGSAAEPIDPVPGATADDPAVALEEPADGEPAANWIEAPPESGVEAADDSVAAGTPLPQTGNASGGPLPDTGNAAGEALPPPANGDAGALSQADSADGAGNLRRITDLGDDELSFGFSDDCWVEIKSATGANLYSDLSRAGSELTLVGQGPFRILLGYAPGARLTFNGEPVPLAPHTRNNVATLVLGQ